MRHHSLTTIIILLSPLAFTFAWALDIYIPVVPQMIKIFDTSQAMIQMTLSIFLVFMGIGQLFFGPLSDQIGRRYVALMSIILFIIGSALCAAANHISVLIIARIVQALGGCGMMNVGQTIVRDLFDEIKSARAYSLLNGSIAFSPLIAPFVGSYLDICFGWRSTFLFLIFLGVICLIFTFFLIKETLPLEKKIHFNMEVFQRYFIVLKSKEFLFYGSCSVVGVACLFCFFSISPYILLKIVNLPQQQFGFYFAAMGITYFIGSLISAFIVEQLGVFKTACLGILMIFVGGIAMLIWNILLGTSAIEFTLPMLAIGVGSSFVLGSAFAGCLKPFPHFTGTAAALIGCYEFLGASIIGTIMMARPIHSSAPYAITVVIMGVIMLIGALLYYLKEQSADSNTQN